MRHSFLNYFKSYNVKNIENNYNIFSYAKYSQQQTLQKSNHTYQNLAFRTKMLDSIDKLNNQPTINTKDFAYSLAEMQIARSYKRFSIKRYQHKSKSIDNYYNAIDVPQAKLRWKNAFLGFAIWSWSGIKNINISGFRSLALSIG
ncbi:MAG: hypothetical protein RLZZ210_1069, partial [Pseudomonadota bacterium]